MEARNDEGAEPLVGKQGLLAFLAGFLFAVGPTLSRLGQGMSLVDAFWPPAVRSLRDEFLIRESPGLIVMLLGLACVLAFAVPSRFQQYHNPVCWGLFGMGSGLILMHMLLDVTYFRGAFLLAPAMYSVLMAPAFIHATARARMASKPAMAAAVAIGMAILLCMIPVLPAVLGYAAQPPERAAFGYGASPGPFETATSVHVYEQPEEVLAAMTGDEDGSTVSTITVRYPVLPQGVNESPVALLFHGFGYPASEEYIDWSTQLSAKGMIVVQIAYPSALDSVGRGDDWTPTEVPGRSDHPQHALRMQSVHAALDVLESDVFPTLNPQPRTDVVWLGGHSLGAGIAMMVLPELTERGWMATALAVDLEQPYAHSDDPSVARLVQGLPASTVVHVVVSEDDTSVGWCHGAAHAQRFADEANHEETLLIRVRSDRHGFPPMVASHYLAATAVHDALADQALYRRADVQADWLVAMMRNDTFTADFAHTHLVDLDLLSPMGSWSDGVPVKPLDVHRATDPQIPEWMASCDLA